MADSWAWIGRARAAAARAREEAAALQEAGESDSGEELETAPGQ